MKILFIMLITISACFSLTKEQTRILKLCYNYGKIYNLGNTLMGICYVESALGIYKVGNNDYGIAQVNIKSHLARIGVKDTYMNRSKYATKLVIDDHYNLYGAIQELLYWKSKKKNWIHYVSAYNRGHKGPINYALKISKSIKLLKGKL